ncbi:MAG: hypothetical protein AB2A00_15490 [Myxococcota bacterium]
MLLRVIPLPAVLCVSILAVAPTVVHAEQRQAPITAAEDDEDLNDDVQSEEAASTPFLEQLKALRVKYFPFWFADDLHPEVENKKWIILGVNFLIPVFFSLADCVFPDFWTPMLLLANKPRYEFEELLVTYAVFQLFRVLMVYPFLLASCVCPPLSGLFLVAYEVWTYVARYLYSMSMLHAWDRIMKRQMPVEGGSAAQTRKAARRSRPARAESDEDMVDEKVPATD